MKGTEADWIKYEVLLEKKAESFELNMKEETTEKQLNRFLEIIEETVKLLFGKKNDFKNSNEKENETKRRNKRKTYRTVHFIRENSFLGKYKIREFFAAFARHLKMALRSFCQIC